MATTSAWRDRHLLAIEGLSPDAIRILLETAKGLAGVSTRSVKKVPTLRGRVVANLFFEDSTRTRNSFELAASRMSADVLNFSGKGSSTSKGESLVDTAKTIEAMGVDVMVCRHAQSGSAKLLTEHVGCSVINAGDGQHEHPTQALLDAYTIGRRLGRDDGWDFSGLTVAIVGDIAHSRVARSNLHALQKLGARVLLVGPPTLVSGAFGGLGATVLNNLDEALEQADVVNMLRIQFERLSGPAFPSEREYHATFGLTQARLDRAKPELLVMHPGPMNRGLEIDPDVADGPQSAILDQVTHGLAVRMAALYLTTGAG